MTTAIVTELLAHLLLAGALLVGLTWLDRRLAKLERSDVEQDMIAAQTASLLAATTDTVATIIAHQHCRVDELTADEEAVLDEAKVEQYIV